MPTNSRSLRSCTDARSTTCSTTPIDRRKETLEEAGLLLRVTPECVRVLCVKGKLPAIQVGKQWRVDKKGLMQMIGGESA
ncbi:helix-turn-helix domain-containing protein [Megamonas hypermegale]|uniref:helix-turn-helix domain-containing protein n=1 Tax=Megamonas hypermegale TaxID=158847 RepID=UPI00350E3505